MIIKVYHILFLNLYFNQKEKNDNVIINVPIEFLSKNSDTLFPVVCKTYFVDSTLINNPVQYINIK